MQIDSATLRRGRLAMREAVRQFLFDPNVTLIDFGHPEHQGRIAEDELTVRVHVRRKLAGHALESAARAGRTCPVPKWIGGFPTDVPVGTYRHHLAMQRSGWWTPHRTNPRAMRTDPLRGGISISSVSDYAYATLGALVIDRSSGAPMILSNWHVLANNWAARPGLATVQPGRLDGGTWMDAVARYSRHAMSANLDAAVAALNADRPCINDQLGVGPIRGISTAELDMEVMKSGRRTGVTFGRVTAVEGVTRLRYSGVDRIIRNVITIEPRAGASEVSGPGDSGSIHLNGANEAIGLHFAGSDQPERALAMDIGVVLDTLDVDLAVAAGGSAIYPIAASLASYRPAA